MIYHNYMLKLGYKKQIIATTSFFVAIIFVDFLLLLENKMGVTCESVLKCVRVLLFGSPYQLVALPSLSVLLSLLPLYFLKEGVFKTWRTFALIYLPIAIFLIVISPEQLDQSFLGMSYGADRESTTIATAGLFVLVSYIIIIYKSYSLRSK